jgi:DNA-binding FadR family transcriptional regulator
VSKEASMHNGQPNVFSSIFTRAELRVINLIFSVILAEGRCTKRLDEIAQLAGTSRSTVRNSIKEAVYHGILERRERRFANAISKPNVLTAPATSGATSRRRYHEHAPGVDGPRAFA